MNIVILHDAISSEARKDEADALVQVRAVGDALQNFGHDWIALGLTLDLEAAKTALEQIRPDLAFNLVESLAGQGRLIHVVCGLLDSLGVPYTGALAEAQFATSNKLFAKRMLRNGYLPTARWYSIDDLRNDECEFHPGRYILKSVWEHASVGLDENSVIAAIDRWQLLEALESRLEQFGGEGFAETYIDGREFNIALLASTENDSSGPEVLPHAEIIFEGYDPTKPKVVGWRAKWEENSFEYHHTPRRYDFGQEDACLLDRLSWLACECWRLFGLRGYARVDFRVDEEGRPWILEVNTNPCLSPDAGFAAALQQARIPFPNAVERILDNALRARRSFDGIGAHRDQVSE